MVATYETKTDYKVIGSSPIRHDGLDKVTGRAIYGGDVKVPGLIWGDVLRSPHAHARIKSIDTSAAKAMDGVFAVLTHADFPKADERVISAGEDTIDLQRDQANIMADSKVHYKGHVVAAVAAVDRNTAEEAAQAIKEKLDHLAKYTARSTVVTANLGDLDVFTATSDATFGYVNCTLVRQGAVVHSHSIEIKKPLDEILTVI